MGVKILFLVPYPLKQSPSQRFRFEQYFTILKARGFEYSVQSFLDSNNWRVFFGSGMISVKVIALVSGFFKRFYVLFKAGFYDFIFIHRETTPIGPPIFEWILAKVMSKKIIYDFDDAIWLTDKEHAGIIERMLKCRGKIRKICQWSYRVSCGNDYLCTYASAFAVSVIYNPTTIDTEAVHNPELYPVRREESTINIGWTGSHSTLKYLKEVEPVLQQIQLQYTNVQFILIADRQPDISLPFFKFISWNVETEITDLLSLDIGIMPMPDDLWTRGKGGFKCLQYMALKIPAIVSPVGINTKIVEHGSNGFLAGTPKEWNEYLTKLIVDKNLRNKIGEAGRKTVLDNYSVLSNKDTFLSLFE